MQHDDQILYDDRDSFMWDSLHGYGDGLYKVLSVMVNYLEFKQEFMIFVFYYELFGISTINTVN